MGGGNHLDNCVVLCRSCHRGITSDRAAVIAKSNRIRAKHIGIAKASRFPCGRGSPFKKKIDGTVAPRIRD